VLVIQTNELLHTGLPVDTVNCLMSSGEQLSSHHQVGSCAKAAHSDELMAFLASFIATSCRKLYDPSTIDTFLVAPKASLFDVLELATPK
jgi:hypothetical protein